MRPLLSDGACAPPRLLRSPLLTILPPRRQSPPRVSSSKADLAAWLPVSRAVLLPSWQPARQPVACPPSPHPRSRPRTPAASAEPARFASASRPSAPPVERFPLSPTVPTEASL